MEKMVHFYIMLICLFLSTSIHAQSLKESLKKSLQTHPEVKQAEKGIDISIYGKDELKADFLPEIDLSLSYGSEIARNVNDSANLNDSDHRLTVRQNIYDSNAKKFRLKRQDYEIQISRLQFLNAKERLSLRAVTAYLNVLQFQKELALAAQNVKSHEEMLEMIKKRESKGVGKSSDVEQVKGRLALSKVEYSRIETQIKLAKVAFKEAFGFEPGKLEEPDDLSRLLPSKLDLAVGKALMHHPDVRIDSTRKLASKKLKKLRFSMPLLN